MRYNGRPRDYPFFSFFVILRIAMQGFLYRKLNFIFYENVKIINNILIND